MTGREPWWRVLDVVGSALFFVLFLAAIGAFAWGIDHLATSGKRACEDYVRSIARGEP